MSRGEAPFWGDVARVFLLQDYNTRVVVLGAAALGLAAGVVGCFTLLRRRALMGDALSHATLPGIGLAFILVTLTGGDGKSLPWLLLGATLAGAAGLGVILLIRNLTRLKEDAALGVVLSVFFGLGVATLGVAQNMQAGHAAGLESFIYGKTASMTASDARLIAIAAGLSVAACALLFKEFRLLCFDAAFARGQGRPTLLLDVLMMAVVVAVTVIGLQAVGLVLIIALLIIPAAAARFWTERLQWMTVISGAMGALSAALGAAISGVRSDTPSGPMIVIVAAALFALSMAFGAARGVAPRLLRQWRLARRIGRQHLLRAVFELSEGEAHSAPSRSRLTSNARGDVTEPPLVSISDLAFMRSWSPRSLHRQIARAHRAGLLDLVDGCVRLTPSGRREAERLTRNHRLWEMYLITHADVAPSHVDRDADHVEHILGPALTAELELLMERDLPPHAMPISPHLLGEGGRA